jgi:hypothetical protein
VLVDDKDLALEERSLVLVDRANGQEVEAVLVDARTGRPLSELDVGLIAGPAASEPFRARPADAAAATWR